MQRRFISIAIGVLAALLFTIIPSYAFLRPVTLAAPQTVTLTGGTWLIYFVKDLDGDGHQDVVTNETNGLAILWGNGDGTFTQADLAIPGIYGYAQPQATYADVNHDGHLDICAISGSNLAVCLWTAARTYAGPVYYPAGNLPRGLVAGDLTGDGWPDFAFADAGDATVGRDPE